MFNKNDGPPIDIIDRLLKKVDLRSTLYFQSSGLTVDDQLLEVFRSNLKSLRNMDKFILNDTAIESSNSAVYNCFSSFRKLKDYHIKTSESNMNVFCQTQIFESRHWESVSLRYTGSTASIKSTTLNNEFLLKAVKQIQRLSVEFNENRPTSFTLDGVVEMIKTLIDGNCTTEYVSLGRIHTKNRSFQEDEKKLRSISSDLKCEFERRYEDIFQNEINLRMPISDCTIKHILKPEDFIRFSICHSNLCYIPDGN